MRYDTIERGDGEREGVEDEREIGGKRKRERDTQQNRERERRTAGVGGGGAEVRERDFVGRCAVAHICKDAPNLNIILPQENDRKRENSP